MNENIENDTNSINNICRACLSTTKHLSPMSNEHIKLYKSNVDEVVFMEYSMKICLICQWMFQKFSKFKHQCWKANQLLSESSCKDSKPLLMQKKLISSYNMTQKNLATYNYTPNLDYTRRDTHSIHTLNTPIITSHNMVSTQTCIKDINKYHTNSDFDNHDIMRNNKYTNENNKYTTENDNYTNENNKYTTENDNYTNENNKYTTENDNYTHENYNYTNENDTLINDDIHGNEDEDELPLVLLCKRKIKKKSKKKKAIEKMPDQKETVKQELIDQEKEVERKKSKKELREGFSSRMVQETTEYVVIKLSREQILREMADRSKTEAYMSSPFKCDKCVRGFNFQDVLDTHLEKHSLKNGTFECDLCGQYCPSAVSLRGHIKSHTTRYQCKVCGAVRASRQHLVEHHAAHSGAAPAYRCLHCAFTTNKRTVMQRHARGHAPREPHACDQCGKLFKNIDYLRLHTARHDKSSRYKCELCSNTFVYHSLLRKHIQCVHERKEFYCVECDVQFKCAESLRIHFKRAKRHRDSTALEHACNKCSATFFTAGSLATHLSQTHDAFKQHACQHCHRTYSTRDAVRAHAWRVHARGDKRASCQQCGTSFARKSVLQAHQRAHRGACGARRTCIEQEKEELPQYESKIEV